MLPDRVRFGQNGESLMQWLASLTPEQRALPVYAEGWTYGDEMEGAFLDMMTKGEIKEIGSGELAIVLS